MKSGQHDWLDQAEGTTCEHELFRKITRCCAGLGVRALCLWTAGTPATVESQDHWQNNYPKPWQERYAYKGYLFRIQPFCMAGVASHLWFGATKSLAVSASFGTRYSLWIVFWLVGIEF